MKILHRTLIEEEQRAGRRLAKMPPRHGRPKYQVRPDIPFSGSVKSDAVADRTTHTPADKAAKTLRKRFASDGFVYPTGHMKKFDLLNRSLELFGSDYILIAKACWYHLLGQALKEVINFGKIRTDLRFPLAFVLPAGHGKLNIENAVDGISKEMGDRVEKPTSYHPEQLIGKVIRIKDSFEKITGHFAADDVIFDDAIELVRSKTSHYQEARRYICKALDMIGRNEVSKKAVNIPDEEALRYSPKCSMILFFQPFSIPEESSLQGLFRRFPIIYLGFEEKDSSSKFEERLEDGPEQNPQADFGRYLLEVRKEKDHSVTFSLGFKDSFKKYHSLLVSFGRTFGHKASNFARTLGHTLQNSLLRLAVILARSEKRTEVNEWDVERAFVDLLEILDSTLRFIEKKVQGSLDYGESWAGAKGKDRQLLEWLSLEGATSEKNSYITIHDYQKRIQEVMNYSESGARNRYKKHKRLGWIASQQRQQTTKVWLTFNPPQDFTRSLDDMGDTVFQAYHKVVEKIEKTKKYQEKEDKKIVSSISPRNGESQKGESSVNITETSEVPSTTTE